MATTSSSTLKDSLVYFKKKLERSTDEEEIVHVIHKLSKIPMTIDLLKGTGAGKIIRVLAKKPGRVGLKASTLLNKWREIMVTSEKSEETFKKDKLSKSSNKGSIKDIKHSNEKHSSEKHSSEKHSSEKHSNEKHSKQKHSKDKHSIENHSKENVSKEKEKHNKDKQNKEKYSKEYSKEKHVKSSHKEKNHSVSSSLKLNGKADVSKQISVKNSFKIANENIIDSENEHDGQSFSDSLKTVEPMYLDPEYFESKRKIEEAISRELCQDFDDSIMSSTPSKHHSSVSKSTKVKNKTQLISSESSKKHHKTDSHSYKTESLSKEKHKKSNGVVKESSSDNLAPKKNKLSSSSAEKKVSKKALKIVPTEEFTASEATFEDCLSFNDIVPVKKRKNTNKPPVISVAKKLKDSSKPKHINKVKTSPESVKISIKQEILDDMFEDIDENLNLKSKVDILSTLPQTQPNYRPLPQRSYDSIPVKKKVLTDEDAIKFTSSRREKTAVYSGRKNCHLTEVPTLFECCTRILIENIDDIEYMGEIPFFLLESMLQRCTPQQLYRIEHFNPYLLEDTNELWEKHCKRDYRKSLPQENETWRELYWRSHEEREQRLRNVTASISKSIASSNPVRKAKLAYIDSVVKPPRDVARRQAKHGTAMATSPSVKVPSPMKQSPKPVVPSVSSASTSKPIAIIKPQKPKVAPLMAKTLKSMKQCFRR